MNCILHLITNEGLHTNINMFEKNEIIPFATKIVYSDKYYTANIEFDQKIDNIQVYINNVFKETDFFNNKITFRDKIFIDYYGYVTISITIFSENKEYLFQSEYIDIAIKKEYFNPNIKKMMHYIMDNYSLFLGTNIIESPNLTSLEKQLAILHEIVFEYQNNYKHFQLKSAFTSKSAQKIVNFEKIKTIYPSTIQYIITNPDQLYPINVNSGITYNKQFFLPKKALIENINKNHDIYENKIVLGFLQSLHFQINNTIKNLNLLLKQDTVSYIDNYYISSSKEIRSVLFSTLKNHCLQLKSINKNIKLLYLKYKKILNCETILISTIPKPTKIFITTFHYHKIYTIITNWFKYGNYDFKKENMVLSLVSSSQIYEYYVLLKLNNYFIDHQYHLTNRYQHNYKMISNALYKNTSYENIFVFKKDNTKITLYYQPVIYNQIIENEVLGLFRNNNINFDGNEYFNSYYAPDYVIKIKRNNQRSYIIIDSKFSDVTTIKKMYLKELVYKYLFSVSTIDPNETIKGVLIINGKNTNDNHQFTNLYNSAHENRINSITPSFHILTLTPEKETIDYLTKLLN